MDTGTESYRRYLEGDDGGMYELVRNYRDGLMLYLNCFTRDIHAAEDLTEDVFVKLAIDRPPFRGTSSFRTWLYAIARNLAVDTLRKQRHIQAVPIESLTLTADEISIEHAVLRKERDIRLHQTMRSLKPAYQQVLYLTFFAEFDNAETAKIMHRTKRQIENLLYAAKKALRRELERKGYHDENL